MRPTISDVRINMNGNTNGSTNGNTNGNTTETPTSSTSTCTDISSKQRDTDNSGHNHVRSDLPITEILNYNKFAESITEAYNGEMSYYSITLDLIAIYLRGQKVIYIESKTLCEQRLNTLMIPAILISAICTVLSVSLKGYHFGGTLVASLTGFNSFLLSVITYLKLDAKSEAHRTSSYQFDKLQTKCEFYSGRNLLLRTDDLKEKTNELVDEIEKKVIEIKDVNQFVIPESVRHNYSNIYGTNVFSIVKKYKADRMMQSQRLLVIQDLLDNKKYRPNPETPGNTHIFQKDDKTFYKKMINMFTDEEELIKIIQEYPILDVYTATENELLTEKNRLLNLIIEYRKISSRINNEFNKEINKNIEKSNNKFIDLYTWLKL